MFHKRTILKNFAIQYSQEKTCFGISFLIKMQAFRRAGLFKINSIIYLWGYRSRDLQILFSQQFRKFHWTNAWFRVSFYESNSIKNRIQHRCFKICEVFNSTFFREQLRWLHFKISNSNNPRICSKIFL